MIMLKETHLPTVPAGQFWYVAFIEVQPNGSNDSLFFWENPEGTPGGGFVHLLLTASSVRSCLDRIEAYVPDAGASLLEVMAIRRVEDVDDLPHDDETNDLDESVAEALSDPEFGASSIAHGVIYFYPVEDETE